jgi:hypothetical protein
VEFFAGRRTRYLPPLRLYVVLSVLFFAAAPFAGKPRVVEVRLGSGGGNGAVNLAPLGEAFGSLPPAKPGETREDAARRECATVEYDGPWSARLRPALRAACAKTVLDGGRSLGAALLHNLPRAMFVFLPLLALVLKLMYWRPPRHYVEHLLLLVHDHAFVFLIVMLYWLMAALLPGGGWGMLCGAAVMLYVPIYLYRSLRVFYAQGRLLTLGKLAVLSFAYALSATLTLMATLIYSAATL